LKILLQLVRGNNGWATASVSPPTVANLRLEVLLPNQSIHSMLAAGLTEFAQVASHFAVAIDRPAFQSGLLDQSAKPLIFRLSCRLRLMLPGVVAARMH